MKTLPVVPYKTIFWYFCTWIKFILIISFHLLPCPITIKTANDIFLLKLCHLFVNLFMCVFLNLSELRDGTTHCTMNKLPVVALKKKRNFLSPVSHQLPRVPQPEGKLGSPMAMHVGGLYWLDFVQILAVMNSLLWVDQHVMSKGHFTFPSSSSDSYTPSFPLSQHPPNQRMALKE